VRKEHVHIAADSNIMNMVGMKLLGIHYDGDPMAREKDEYEQPTVDEAQETEAEGEVARQHAQLRKSSLDSLFIASSKQKDLSMRSSPIVSYPNSQATKFRNC